MKNYESRVTFRTTKQLYLDLHIICTIAGYHSFNEFMNEVLSDYVENVLPLDLRAKSKSLRDLDITK